MRTFSTLRFTLVFSAIFLSFQFSFATKYSLSFEKDATVNFAEFFGGDTTCLDTFHVKYIGSSSISFKVYPPCDTVEWRYVQVDTLTPLTNIADTLWQEGSMLDTCCFVIEGLSPSTSYMIQLRGWCPDANAYTPWSEVVFKTTKCEGPDVADLSVANLTHTSVTLIADVTSDAFEWTLQRVGSGSFRHIETSDNKITWINLPASKEYNWKVRIMCADGTWSDYSEFQSFFTDGHTVNDCDTLQNDHLSVNGITYNSASLHCHMTGKSYTWGMRKYGHSSWTHHTTSSGYYQWKNLSSHSKYEYKVKVQCGDGYWTDWSSVKYFTTKDHYSSCTTPKSQHMTVKDLTYESATLHCKMQGAEYHWTYKQYGNYSWKDHSSHSDSYGWNNLKPKTKYAYKVKVKCHDGSWTGWSAVYYFTTKDHYANDCHTPQSHQVYTKNLTHDAVSTYCDVKGTEYHWAMKKWGSNYWSQHSSSHSYYNWGSLNTNTKYEYKVKVKCHNGYWTDWSTGHYFTTKDHYGSSCSTPQTHHLSVKEITYQSASTHCEMYGMEYHWAIRPYGSSDWSHKTTSTPHYGWTGLSYNTKYEYKVKVKCHNGYWTNWSYVHHFTTSDHYGSMCSTPQKHHMSVKDLTYNSATTHCAVHGSKYHWMIRKHGSYGWQDYTSSSGHHGWKNLKSNTKYEYKVKVNCGNGYWTGWSYSNYFTTKEQYGSSCSTPQGHHMSVSHLDYQSATTHCAVNGYEYHWAVRRHGSSYWKDYTTTHGSYHWTNLQSNSKYEYKVKVKCRSGYWTGWSYGHHFTTKAHYGSSCGTPQSHHLSVNNLSYHGASTHCAISGSEYHWSMKPYGSSSWKHHKSNTGYADWSNLHSNTKYEYKVKVNCGNGVWTGWSNVHHFTTHKSSYGSYCNSPSGSQYGAVQEAYNLFRIYCYIPAVKFTCAIKPSSSYQWSQHSTSVNNMGWGNLLPHTKYEYKVQIDCHGGGTSNWSSVKYFWTGGGSTGRPNDGLPSIIDLSESDVREIPAQGETSIYPSPASTFFSVGGAIAGSEVTVLNMQGQVLLQNQIISDQDQINIDALENGIYNVMITNVEGTTESKKLVVVR